MKEVFILTIASLLFVSNTSGLIQQEGININEIYLKLSKDHNVNYQKVGGEFIYSENNENGIIYIASFFGKEKKYSIVHTGYSGNKKDNIRFNNRLFTLDYKIDPLSFVVYKLHLGNKRYVCLIGKSQSASGSGAQVSYFTVFELDKLGMVTNCYKFSSRFGNIHNIVDYYNSIGYFKVVNGDKMGQYMLTVNDIKNNKRINSKSVLLGYKLNDKFVVLNDNLISVR